MKAEYKTAYKISSLEHQTGPNLMLGLPALSLPIPVQSFQRVEYSVRPTCMPQSSAIVPSLAPTTQEPDVPRGFQFSVL